MVTGTMQSVPPSMMNGNMAASNELPKRPGDNRRSNKPIMEKRRRARINNCLNELKTLILDATKKDPARHSKLEKADILEKTVKYLQDLQRQQTAMLQASDPQIYNKFKAGFAECIKEVDRFPGIDPAIKRRLLQHLGTYISGVRAEDNNKTKIQQVQIHMLPSSPPGSPEQDQQLLHTQQQILQLTPTNGCYLSLPNGVVYLAPPHIQQIPPKVAMPSLTNIVNIPSRTSSTASATSNHSSTEKLNHDLLQSPMCYAPPSPANSYEAMEYPTPTPPENHYHKSMNSYQLKNMNLHASAEPHRPYSPGPLSLVMKKEGQNDEEEERPWRPW